MLESVVGTCDHLGQIDTLGSLNLHCRWYLHLCWDERHPGQRMQGKKRVRVVSKRQTSAEVAMAMGSWTDLKRKRKKAEDWQLLV